ncbi:hypothetical protein KPL71_015177 [Citrus sinensis]|uniref:Uncharacterized protein n=1 Tax=Citrus sinensis TaxID=2711 RepID=A0ACB8KH87_CITSI|nr:hypothetical protein KPL71_015177 [Citrus sinensis]
MGRESCLLHLFGTSHDLMENERETLLGILCDQVDAEKIYHQHVIAILEKLYAEVIHPFDAQANGELSLLIDDYVVVRQVARTGWLEGECKGQAGWFPSAYIERREKAPASKISEANSSPECDVTS